MKHASNVALRIAPSLRSPGDLLDPLWVQLELGGRREDLLPGLVVHRNSLALALGAVLALRLTGDAHVVVAGRDARGAQPGEEALRILGERGLRAEPCRVEDDRQHAVQHAALRLV